MFIVGVVESSSANSLFVILLEFGSKQCTLCAIAHVSLFCIG